MPSSFPFFRLPFLIQLLILENASLLGLFKFSLISKRSKQIVKSLGFKLPRLYWKFNDHVNYREINMGKAEDYKLSIFTESDQMELEGFIPSGELTFHGNVLPVYSKVGWDYLIIRSEITMNESMELMEQLTKYFLDLFNGSEYDLTLNNFSNLRDCFVWKYTKHFQNLEVSDHRTLTSDDMKFVLEELTIEYELSIWTNSVFEGFKYSGPLKMSKLVTTNTNWLALEAVLNMDCEHLVLHSTTFTYQDLNAIIRKWLDGGLENLKEFQIDFLDPFSGDSRDTKLDHILEGIETFPSDIRNRPQETRRQNCRDIRRSDGTIATIDLIGISFIFQIWDFLSVD